MTDQEEPAMGKRSVTHATFTIERTYDASAARVFNAFADPAAKARWFVGSDEQDAFLDGYDIPADREHGTGGLLDNLGRELRREAART
jgi:hypothetical protein